MANTPMQAGFKRGARRTVWAVLRPSWTRGPNPGGAPNGQARLSGVAAVSKGIGARGGGGLAWRRCCWATVGPEPVGFQEGKLKIPPSRHGWNPERTGIQFQSCCRRGQGVVTRRALQQLCWAGCCRGLGPRTGHLLAECLSRWARSGQGQRVTGSPVALSVSLPSCPLHSLASYLQASSAEVPAPACLELGAIAPKFWIP